MQTPTPMSMPVLPPRAVLRPPWLTRPTPAVQAFIGTTIVLAWVLLEWATQQFLTAPGVSGWYPPAGLGVAVLWATRWRYLWAVGGAAWLGQVMIWGGGSPLTVEAILAGTAITAAKVGVYMLAGRFLAAVMPALEPMRLTRQAVWVVLALVGCASLTGVVGVGGRAVFDLGYGPSLYGAMLGWAVGDAIGLLITAPLVVWVVLPILCRWTPRRRRSGASAGAVLPAVPGSVWRPAGWAVLTAVLLIGLYNLPVTRGLNVMFVAYLALPLIALAYGLAGGLVALAVVNVLALSALGGMTPGYQLVLESQLVMIAMAVSVLLVGSVSTQRSRAQQQAEEERRWTALALRGGGLGRWQWEVGTTRLMTDFLLSDRLGYPREQVRHDTRWWRPRIHPEDEGPRVASLQKCLSGELAYHDVENRIMDASGGWVWFHTQGVVIERDDQGRPTLMAGTHREISERKRLAALERDAEATHRSERRFRALAKASPVGVFQTDAQGAMLYVNPAWTATTGLPMAEALYRHAPAFVHPDDRDAVADHWMTATRLGVPLRCEMRVVQPGGTTRWVSMQASPFTEQPGRPGGYVGTVVDITDYREQVAMIADSEARYRTLADHANDMLWRVTAEGVYTYASPSVHALLGYTPEEIVGTDAYDYFHPDDIEQVRTKHARMSPESPDFVNTHRYRRKDGEYVVLDAIGKLVTPDDPDEPPYIVGISRDVTRRIEAEQQREELEQRLLRTQKLDALGGFARGVAHDFRNTLLAINLSAQSAARQLEPGHPARRPMELIEEACTQASEITQSLLTFARGQGASKETLDLAQVVGESARLLDALLPSGVAVAYEPAKDEALWVEGNRAELQQVLMNLAMNARDAMPAGGTIRLKLAAREGNAVLTFTDDGQGMDEATRRRVFEPFFTTKTRLKGTGLGLALVHGVVEHHGGAVMIRSQPGEGTAVTIELPLLPDSAGGVDPPAQPAREEATAR